MYKQGFTRGAPHERSRGAYGSSRQDTRTPRAQPKPEPAMLASAIRLKNFRQLHDIAGEENLAMALDLPLQRIRELHEGLNFSDETTFHLETTLGLRSGYFDQVNPQLSEDDVKRLKTPLESHLSPTDRLPEHPEQEIPVAPHLKSAVPQAQSSNAVVARHAQQAKSAGAGQSKKATAAASKPSAAPKHQAVPKHQAASNQPATPVQQPLNIHEEPMNAPASMAAPAAAIPGGIDTDELKLREVRRSNLALITQQPGSKSHLGRLTGMSPANISHRLHGNKHFDDETAQFFCEKLNLPLGWFNEPHTEDDVPAEVFQLLGGSPRANVPSNRGGRPSRTRKTSPAAASASADAPAAMEMPATPAAGVALRSAVLSPSLQPAPARQPALATTAVQPAARPARTASQPASAPAPAPAPTPAAAAPAAAPAAPAPALVPVVSASPVANVLAVAEGELHPIAEALIKTLALKARQGKLTEETALKLLTETMAL